MDQKVTRFNFAYLSISFASSADALTVQNVSAYSGVTVASVILACLFFITTILLYWRWKHCSVSKEGAHLRVLWSYVPDIITEVNSAGIIQKVNRTAPGFTKDDVVGRDSREFLTPEGRVAFETALNRVVTSGEPQRYELKLQSQDGGVIWFENQILAISDRGFSDSFLVLSSDITERKKAHQVLVTQRKNAEQANQAKSSFLASMSHEIRTPMTGMLGMASILEQTELNAEQQECVRTIQSSAEHLLAVVNDVLDLSKIEANKLEIENETFSIHEMISSLLDMNSSRAREKGLSLQSFVDEGVPDCIISDAVRVRQILMNYLSNAIKFTMKGHVILRVVAIQQQQSTVKLRFSVEDSGIGMSPEKAGNIFEEFSDAHGRLSTLVGGTGLGLSICKRLAGMMGGNVGVVSTPDLGSSFWLDLEVAVASCQTSVNHVENDRLAMEDLSSWVIDDVKVNRLLSKEVARRIGFSVREFNDIETLLA